MKLVRMIKTMAGPNGVRTAGDVLSMSDQEALILLDARVIEVVADIRPPAPESTATTGAPETTARAKPTRRKRAPRKSKAGE